MNKYIVILLLAFIWSCSAPQNNKTAIAVAEDEATESPYLTLDTDGNPVLSWVKERDNNESVMYFSVLKDGILEKNIELEVSKGVQPHGENLPKMIYKPNGDIIVAWGAANPNPNNRYSAVIYYAQSFDNGETWTEAQALVSDNTSYDQRYFDLTILPNGEVAIVWLDNRERVGDHGMTVFFAQTEGINGFHAGKIIGRTSCECCRTKLMVDSENRIHLAYRAILEGSIRDMVHQVSEDNGVTFSTPRRISPDNWMLDACPHTGPTMTENEDGIHVVWFTGGNERPGIYYTSNINDSQDFENANLLSTNAKHPQMTTLSDGSLATVWGEVTLGTNGYYSKIVLLHSLKNGEQKRYDITNEDMNATFPVIVPTKNKTVTIAWKGSHNILQDEEGHHDSTPVGQVFTKTIHL